MRYDPINPHNLRHISEVLAEHARFLELARGLVPECTSDPDAAVLDGGLRGISRDLSNIAAALSEHLVDEEAKEALTQQLTTATAPARPLSPAVLKIIRASVDQMKAQSERAAVTRLH